MAKKKKETRFRGYRPPKEKPQKRWSEWLADRFSPFWRFVVIIFTLVSFYITWITIEPYVKIEKGSPVDPSQPFSARMKITNESLYKITDTRMSCTVVNAKSLTGNTYDNLQGEHDSGNIGVLQRHGTAEVACPFLWKDPNTYYMDIDVIVSFNCLWGWYSTTAKKRMLLVKDADGKFQWLEKSESSRRPGAEERPSQLQP